MSFVENNQLMKPIYLDHNATSPIDPRVVEVMAECYRAGHANPASQHEAGRQARRVLEEARESIARLLGADIEGDQSDRLIFTSGATEANNLVLRGLAGRPPGRLIVSAVEHPSVHGVAEQLQREGFQVTWIGVSRDGLVDLDQLRRSIDKTTRLVSVVLGNHETGVLQPIRAIATICRDAGVPLHSDAAQAVGKVDLGFRKLGVAALSLSAHKFGGPCGIGALFVRGDVLLEPILYGGFQQMGLRPGTESIALAVGLHVALRLCLDQADAKTRRIASLRDRLERLLREKWPELVIHGADAPRLPHTSCVSFPGLDRQALLIALDLAGLACSSGSACASGSSEPSPVLRAMGCSPAELHGSLRLSLGSSTTIAEVEQAASRIIAACGNLRRS